MRLRSAPIAVALLSLAALTLSCTRTTVPTTTVVDPSATTATTGAPRPDPHFYLNLIWHQHQPRYPLLEDGTVSRPWVRVHATKDYYDMAALVSEYPNVKVTFNLTPILLLQLEELASGTKDIYWMLTEVPAEDLTEEQIEFVKSRFFDVNPLVIEQFPRFQELAAARDTDFSIDDLRDLQVLFNLAWTDPGFLAQEPLASLVIKGEGFTEEDKAVVMAEHLRIVSEVITLHARLWEEGRIEVITTPLAHPILPLISDTSLATVGDPAALMPVNRFQEIPDADQQVIRGLDEAERLLGRRPVGMWPGEGSVSQLVMSLFSKNGVQWVASGEEVLAQTLDIGSFTRDESDLVEQGDLLYRPWSAQLNRNDPVPMFFRDGLLSDLIGFEYSGTEANAAADDFMGRLRAIRDSLDVESAFDAGQPYVVSVILDGENAWENYPDDGIDFLSAVYQRLNDSDWISTITGTDYLDRFGKPEALPGDVWPGAWFQPNFATWIGEEEEATAWDYLYQVRQDLAVEEDNPGYHEAYTQMLFAEGSDWFWWYGSDQDSGDDGYFDQAYRDLLGTVYDALGIDRPSFLAVPIIPETPSLVLTPTELMTITIDGEFDDWTGAASDGTLATGFDRENLYLRYPSDRPGEVYLGMPRGAKSATTAGGIPLGFGATHVVAVGDECGVGPVLSEFTPIECAIGDGSIEIAIPLSVLGALAPGDLILAKFDDGSGILTPAGLGPVALQVPDISNVAVFLDVADPVGDDHGPGTYTYPSDAVFTQGSYDIERFTVGTENDQLVFAFDMVAPIQNPWGSPRNFSIQTFDIYIDTDVGSDNGERSLLDGRNASVAEGSGWEFGITIEGWEPAIYRAGAEGTVEETRPTFDVAVFGDQGRVVVRIPLSLLGVGDPATWGYAAVVLSQEGFPSQGVRRVRDVEASAQQFRLGGAPDDANHTRIIDVAWATEGEQEQLLSTYPASATLEDLIPDDFGLVPMATPS
ncbi:MAG TPA: glucodextranase DOMON-like domain-containing protein [Acidimicrobiia bacterium]|nr:glucodextranase DOMON-like domain-containing protein [Acidimicrobiia bacterium]